MGGRFYDDHSKVDASGELDLAAVVAARYPGALPHGAAADSQIRIAGHECVRQIVELHPKFELHPLGDFEVFDQCRVKLPEAGTAQAVIEPRIGSRSIGREDLERGWVEVISGRNTLGRIASHLGRAKLQQVTVPPHEDV